MTQEEALAYCEEHDLRSTMSRERRLGMTREQARAFAMAFSTSDPAEMPPHVVEWFNATVDRLDKETASS